MLHLFDIKTLLLTSVLVNLAIAGLLIYYWKFQQTYRGFGFWAASHAIGSGTYLLYALRGQIPDFLSIVVSGTLVILFGTLRLEGIRLFIVGTWRPIIPIVYPAMIAPPLFYFTYISDDIMIRTVLINTLLAVITVQMMIVLARKACQNGNTIYWAPFLFFGTFVSILVCRFFVLAFNPDVRGFFAASTANHLFFLIILLHDVGIAISYLMLNTKRRTDELQQAQLHLQGFNVKLQQQVRDETERRLVQERLLAHNARLAAMGEMVGVIAHQWRQPLTTLGMILQRLEVQQQRGLLTVAAFTEARETGMQQIRTMSETIDDFRNFYSPDRNRSTFQVCRKLREAIALTEGAFAADSINLVVRCELTDRDTLHGFPNQFVQAVLNLLTNARDAIQAAAHPAGETANGLIRIHAMAADGRIAISVTDNGCGIPKQLADRIFDSFVTSKESAGGTGIGLYLTRTIVEDSFGGHLSFRSCPGETVFTMTFPAATKEDTDGTT